MITFKEIIGNYFLSDIPHNHQVNIDELLKRINIIRAKYGQPMIVSSGYRTMNDHIRIYSQKGITDPKKIPLKSRHLSGEAIDIRDPEGKLQAWILANIQVLEEAGLWCEDFAHTSGWVHFQTVPPASGKRFFIP